MAKRKPKPAAAPKPSLPHSTTELTGDPRNPRFISDQSSAGLAKSLAEFGDLSGIVWNRQLGQLVAGHQRIRQIETKWGPQTIEIIDAERELGVIRIDDGGAAATDAGPAGHCFVVRIVDWPLEKHAAANVTANNPKIQGEFTGDVVAYMRDIQTLLGEASPSLMDDVLLADLLADYAAKEQTALTKIAVKSTPAMVWVLVGIQTPRFGRIAEFMDQMGAVPDIIIESTLNDQAAAD